VPGAPARTGRRSLSASIAAEDAVQVEEGLAHAHEHDIGQSPVLAPARRAPRRKRTWSTISADTSRSRPRNPARRSRRNGQPDPRKGRPGSRMHNVCRSREPGPCRISASVPISDERPRRRGRWRAFSVRTRRRPRASPCRRTVSKTNARVERRAEGTGQGCPRPRIEAAVPAATSAFRDLGAPRNAGPRRAPPAHAH